MEEEHKPILQNVYDLDTIALQANGKMSLRYYPLKVYVAHKLQEKKNVEKLSAMGAHHIIIEKWPVCTSSSLPQVTAVELQYVELSKILSTIPPIVNDKA